MTPPGYPYDVVVKLRAVKNVKNNLYSWMTHIIEWTVKRNLQKKQKKQSTLGVTNKLKR